MPAALRNLNADYDDKDAEESDPDEHDTIAALDERVDAATAQLKSKGKGKGKAKAKTGEAPAASEGSSAPKRRGRKAAKSASVVVSSSESTTGGVVLSLQSKLSPLYALEPGCTITPTTLS